MWVRVLRVRRLLFGARFDADSHAGEMGKCSGDLSEADPVYQGNQGVHAVVEGQVDGLHGVTFVPVVRGACRTVCDREVQPIVAENVGRYPCDACREFPRVSVHATSENNDRALT